jgi:hypothetical protein
MIPGEMAVQYGSPDFFPQTWALYTCPCGRSECEHGRHAGEPPPGWHHVKTGDEDIAVCPTCWATVRRDAATTPS